MERREGLRASEVRASRALDISRRDAAKAMIVGGLAFAGLPAGARLLHASERASGAQPVSRLRVAHLTDLHIQPERRAAAGVAACLAHVREHAKPDLIITGGDLIMDAFEQSFDRTKLLWGLLTDALKDAGAPVSHCLGNHDIWGWNKGKSKTTGKEAGWGKAWAMEALGLATLYHAFDRGGWHVVVLDSVREDPRDPDGYIGGLDDEQFAWLSADLKAHRAKPTMVVSHIPIMSVTVLDAGVDKDGSKRVGGGVTFADWPRIKGLLLQNPQVRLAISGHMHLIDRVEYNGVTYCCNGAVSGNWWKGMHKECREGYTVVDLYADGAFQNTYVPFGWQAAAGE